MNNLDMFQERLRRAFCLKNLPLSSWLGQILTMFQALANLPTFQNICDYSSSQFGHLQSPYVAYYLKHILKVNQIAPS